MKNPDMNVVKFEANDIMTASGETLYRFSGLGDGAYNATFGIDGQNPLYAATSDIHGFEELTDKVMSTVPFDGSTKVYHSDFPGSYVSFDTLVLKGDNVEDSINKALWNMLTIDPSKYNGVYTFDKENNSFTWYAAN